MKLQDVKDFYPTAKQRLEKAPEEKKIVMLYAAIIKEQVDIDFVHLEIA